MKDADGLKARVKAMIVENLMLQVSTADLADDQPLFGPGSLGLDSVDALQLVVALDKTFGLKIADPGEAKPTLHSVNIISQAVQEKLAVSSGSNPPQPSGMLCAFPPISSRSASNSTFAA